MSLSSVSSDSESSSLSGIAFPPLKKWADCHKLDEKIACIVGNIKIIIGYAFSVGAAAIGTLCRKVFSVLPFGAISKFFLDTFNMVCKGIGEIANMIGPLAGKAIGSCINGIVKFCYGVKQLLPLHEITRFVLATLNAAQQGLRHCFKWLSETILTDAFYQRIANIQNSALSFFQSCLRAVQDLLNRTIVPLLNSLSATLSSFADRVSAVFSRIECRCLGQCSEGLEIMVKWTVVPLYQRVISPICKTLGDISYGICHGCCGRQAPEEDDEIRQKEEDNKLKKA